MGYSKAILISIRPQWCDLIQKGIKTVEVRKTRPRLDVPFRCYIYETRGFQRVGNESLNCIIGGNGRGKVIGEFICDHIQRSDVPYPAWQKDLNYELAKQACLTYSDLHDYIGSGNSFYGWHISNLVIYDEPKELSDFFRWYDAGADPRPCQNGKSCKEEYYDLSEDTMACMIDFDGDNCPFYHVQRPPQSWCYVEGTYTATSSVDRMKQE